MFDVLADHDPVNLLYRQAFDEMTHHLIEMDRLREVLDRLNSGKWVITHPTAPTPFSFPILVDRLRSSLTSEALESPNQAHVQGRGLTPCSVLTCAHARMWFSPGITGVDAVGCCAFFAVQGMGCGPKAP